MHPTIDKIQKGKLKKVPEVKTGFTVRVSQKVTEGTKERVQNFEGLVIKVSHGAGVEKTFTVRKIVEGIGVEKIFPFHSPNITKIHIVKKAKVRREKLYYMRERFGKSARLSEKHVTDEERAAEEAKMEALYAEAVKEDEKRKSAEDAANPEVAEVADTPGAEESAPEVPAETPAEPEVETPAEADTPQNDTVGEASEAAEGESNDEPTDAVDTPESDTASDEVSEAGEGEEVEKES